MNAHFNNTDWNITAVGQTAMYFNISGTSNVAIGNSALQNNEEGCNEAALPVGDADEAANSVRLR